ncbi:MAG: hypothetical protein HZA50_16120 [Planctomycetes bacterium]|nr:hypothetical protein [Planctomycetota bacterium]
MSAFIRMSWFAKLTLGLFLAYAVGAFAWADAAKDKAAATAPGSFRFVDLRPVVNMGFRDSVEGDGKGGWMDQGGNDMRFLPVGKQKFGGIEFDVIDPKSNNGKSCLVLYGEKGTIFPVEAEVKGINQNARSVYFLHAAAWNHKDVGVTYTVTYEDGSKAEIPIRGGEEINDWWNPKDGKSCRVAWHGPNLDSANVGVLLYGWENPNPGKAIAAIRFTSAKTKMVPVVLAVTLSDGAVQLPPPAETVDPEKKRLEDEQLEFQEGQAAMLGKKKFVGEVKKEDIPAKLELGKTGYTPAEQASAFKVPGMQATSMHNPEKLPVGGAADVSFLNEKPAGKRGRLQLKDGKLIFADGTPARFLSTNLTYGIMFPTTKEEASQRAKWLAANGINMVRVHHFSHSGKDGQSLYDFWENAPEDARKGESRYARYANTRTYDKKAWDNFDMMMAALKEEGIYVHVCLLVFPWIGREEAVEKNIPPGLDDYRSEGAQIFIREWIDRMNVFVKDFFQHKNPYTGVAYAEDPMFASAELINEDSIGWRGNDPYRASGYYFMELHEQYNNWLLKKYGSTENLRKAWGEDAMNDWEALIPDCNLMKAGKKFPEPHSFTETPKGFKTCDLGPAVNTTYTDKFGRDGKDGWCDAGKDVDMRFFPTGKEIFLGIPFDVSAKGPVLIADKDSFADIGKGKGVRPDPRKENPWPKSVTLSEKGKAKSIYFLHTFGWLGKWKNEVPVFFYDICYGDGSKETIGVRSGSEIADWGKPMSVNSMRAAWHGMALAVPSIGLSLFGWNNPHPDKEITQIVARIEGNPALVSILGVTLSDAAVNLPAPADVPSLPEWKKFVRLWPYAARFEKEGWNEALLRRASDQLRFLYDVQTGYFLRQKKFIQDELGFKGLLLGSNWKTPPLMQMMDHYSNAQLDILDQHNYGSSNGFMRAPGSGTFTAGLIRVLGKPMMISEWYPARVEPYRLCVFPLLCLYGQGLNGWEFPMQFSTRRLGWGFYEHWDEGINYPMDLSQYPAMALAIRRGDLKEGPVVYKRMMSKEEIFAEKVGIEHNYENKYLAMGKVGTEYVDKACQDFLDQTTIDKCWDKKADVVKSATGELEWDYGKGVAFCRTDRTQGAVGFLNRVEPIKLPAADVTVKNLFAAIWLSSLDNSPIASSDRILVTIVGRNDSPVNDKGEPRTYNPVIIEGVAGTVALQSAKADQLKVYTIGFDGQAIGKLDAKVENGRLRFAFDTMTFKGPYLLITSKDMPLGEKK